MYAVIRSAKAYLLFVTSGVAPPFSLISELAVKPIFVLISTLLQTVNRKIPL